MGYWRAEPVIEGEYEKVYDVNYSSWDKAENEKDGLDEITGMLNNGWHIESITGISQHSAFCVHLKKTYYCSPLAN